MLIDCMVYGFMYSCLFFQKYLCLFLNRDKCRRNRKNPENRKNCRKIFQLVHRFKEKFKHSVVPLKYNSTNSVLKCAGETAAVEEREGTACALLSDFLFVVTPHAPLWSPLQRSRPVHLVGASRPTSKYRQAGLLSQHLHGQAKAPSSWQKCKSQIKQGCMFSHARESDC